MPRVAPAFVITASAPRYRGRFAPSPTGPLHFGSLIAALASWCDARAHGGKWLLRIEDVDTARSRSNAADHILSALELHGFEWDGPVVHQSERGALYRAARDELARRDLVFECSCTRAALEAAPRGAGGERVYPGTCRADAAKGRASAALRVAVRDELVGFQDRVQGWHEQNLQRDVGDFVIQRADGLFAYQLAVVVDDAAQGITHVVRGADLLASTPRQLWLQRELGYPSPAYLHHAVALDSQGMKLSKQSGAAPLTGDPVPALIKAWRFLDQREPPSAPAAVREFWQWAHASWDPRRLPPVTMLPHGIIHH